MSCDRAMHCQSVRLQAKRRFAPWRTRCLGYWQDRRLVPTPQREGRQTRLWTMHLARVRLEFEERDSRDIRG